MRLISRARARLSGGLLSALLLTNALALGQSPSDAKSATVRTAGTVKSVDATGITLSTDTGQQVVVTAAAATRMLRVEPGQTDLKQAKPAELHDLQPGDRVVVRGETAGPGQPIQASTIFLMKHGDVAAKQQQQREDWQRGIGGIVTAVDTESGTITVNTGGLGAAHPTVIHTNKSTVARRYAPASVKYESAQAAPINDIKIGDQLRARGTRSADDNEFTADEIVSGTFRNIAGTITSVDSANNSFTVHDLIAKAPADVKVASESQLKAMPPEIAQRMAAAVRASASGGSGQQPSPVAGQSAATAASGGRQRGGGDFQRFLARMPDTTLASLKKGDAVMIVTTPGENSVTAITLLRGVEPILTAAPKKNASAVLSPWTLGAAVGEGEAGP
jgi:hypothetical protein